MGHISFWESNSNSAFKILHAFHWTRQYLTFFITAFLDPILSQMFPVRLFTLFFSGYISILSSLTLLGHLLDFDFVIIVVVVVGKLFLLSHSFNLKILPDLPGIRQSGFTSLGFGTIISYIAKSSALRLTFSLEDQISVWPPLVGWPSFIPRHPVSFSSPSTTRRTMVGVF
jgi:hypothetical protein